MADTSLPASRRVMTTVDLTQPEILAELRHWSDSTRHPDPVRTVEQDATLLDDVNLADVAAYLIRLGAISAQLQTSSNAQLTLSAGHLTASMVASTETTRATLDAAAEKVRADTASAFTGFTEEVRGLVGPALASQIETMLRGVLDPTASTGAVGPLLERLNELHTQAADTRQALAQAQEQIVAERAAHMAALHEATTTLATTATRTVTAAETSALNSIEVGKGFEAAMIEVFDSLSGVYGGDFDATGTATGSDGTTTGDGVLLTASGTRVGIETTIRANRSWSGTVEQVRRNRHCPAVLGVVPAVEQNKGALLRWIDDTAVIVAHTPGDDPKLLWAVVSLLDARVRLSRSSGAADVRRVEEAAELVARADARAAGLSTTASLITSTMTTMEKIRGQVIATRRDVLSDLTDAAQLLAAAIPDPEEVPAPTVELVPERPSLPSDTASPAGSGIPELPPMPTPASTGAMNAWDENLRRVVQESQVSDEADVPPAADMGN